MRYELVAGGGVVEVSVVVPVYGSTATLGHLANRIESTLVHLGEYEIIMVDDGSPEATWQVLLALTRNNPRIRALRLGRNFGQHNALIAGIRAAKYSVVVTIDDDLQNPPEEIPHLVALLDANGLDVVYGVPEHVAQTLPRRLASSMMRRALTGGMGVSSASHVTSYRAFRTSLREAFDQDLGSNVSLDALLTWGTSDFGSLKVRHDARASGYSNYNFRRLFRFAIDTTTGYSTVPLQAASVVGFFAALLGFSSLLWVVGRPMVTGESVPGFQFLASTIAIFAGVQLLTLGVIGEYLARMHFRIMRKPTYVIRAEASSSGELDTAPGDGQAADP